jgi:hypothetical protein
VLLDLASLIFEEQQSLEVILKKIAATIISFMQVQKCTIFIVDEDCSVSTEYDFFIFRKTETGILKAPLLNIFVASEPTPKANYICSLCKTT